MTFAYIAGFFDGEGHISLIPKIYRCIVQITQGVSQHQVLFDIKECIGQHGIQCQIHTLPKTKYNAKSKPCSVLLITNAESIAPFLEKIIPYLVIKKRVALKALETARKTIQRRQDSAIKIAACVAEYEAGASVRSLTAKHGISRQTIRRHVKAAGVPFRDGVTALRLYLATAPDSYIQQRKAAGIKGNLARHSRM